MTQLKTIKFTRTSYIAVKLLPVLSQLLDVCSYGYSSCRTFVSCALAIITEFALLNINGPVVTSTKPPSKVVTNLSSAIKKRRGKSRFTSDWADRRESAETQQM
jgi:hypothetical protein